MEDVLTFQIIGRFKPYVRMTQRGKWVKHDAQEYLASKARLQHEFGCQMGIQGWDMLPDQTALGILVVARAPGGMNNRDFDNELKAITDAAQGVAFRNDLWINYGAILKLPHQNLSDWHTSVRIWTLGTLWQAWDPFDALAMTGDAISGLYDEFH